MMEYYQNLTAEKLIEAQLHHAMKDARRPGSAFLIFLKEQRQMIQAKHPEYGAGEISKLGSQLWRGLSEEEKSEYKEKFKRQQSDYDAKKLEAMVDSVKLYLKKQLPGERGLRNRAKLLSKRRKELLAMDFKPPQKITLPPPEEIFAEPVPRRPSIEAEPRLDTIFQSPHNFGGFSPSHSHPFALDNLIVGNLSRLLSNGYAGLSSGSLFEGIPPNSDRFA
eukprot:TRINITY_DN2660_c0_g1_i2.p1 TRINITY_DN2660_c0_g1~~TRINITY_DN2660_c0_g1_i2.p1  ORF type:complete len:221 (+),score=63.76 TRINITY_DN2660_c0_g1_i2:406-1068(+)